MTEPIERNNGIESDPEGAFVYYDEYVAIRAERDKAFKARDNFMEVVESMRKERTTMQRDYAKEHQRANVYFDLAVSKDEKIADLTRQLAELVRLNHPTCLNCGKTDPCTIEEPNACTFDMTPRQIFEWCKTLKAKLDDSNEHLESQRQETYKAVEREHAQKKALAESNNEVLVARNLAELSCGIIEDYKLKLAASEQALKTMTDECEFWKRESVRM